MIQKTRQLLSARNALTDKEFNIQMDLQLFGGGGKGGKSTGKLIGSIVVGVLCGGFGTFGAAATAGFVSGATGCFSFASAFLGASLFSSIWTAATGSSNDFDNNSGENNIERFDKAQETMSSSGSIPIIYGQRKISGNQTFHETNAEQTTLHKHVVLCEGEIEGIDSVCANGLIIPTGTQTSNTVFTLRNVKYSDATVSFSGKTLTLSCSGGRHSFHVCNKEDFENSEGENVWWSYQTNVASLISYINMLNGEGWEAFPVAGTYKYPGDLSISRNGNVYNNPVNFTASAISGGTNYKFHDCEAPSNYTEVGGYPNMAWLDMTFYVTSELGGNPSVDCIVKGKKVYDTRTRKKAYSTNPAMCLRDFILSERYGLGKWFDESILDEESWKEAADYCDEVIQFKNNSGAVVSAKRYELNMIIDSKRSAMDWLQEILANFSGFLVFSDGKLKLRIEKRTSISYKFDDSNCKDLKVSPLALNETPNRYEVTIVDPLNNWNTIKALCEDFADQKTRQKVVTKAVSLEGVTSQNQALRLARFYRDYNLVCPLQVSFTTGMQGMHLEPGDVVTISYHNVFKELPIRINEITESNKGEFEISGRQYNDTIYGDGLGGGIHFYNYSQVGNPHTDYIPIVKNLNVEQVYYVQPNGMALSELHLTWDKITYQYYKRVCIEYSVDGEKTWITHGSAFNNSYVMNTIVGSTYAIRLRIENSIGRLGDAVTYSGIYITGKDKPPPATTNIEFEIVNGGVKLKWDKVDELDIRGYSVYVGEGKCGIDACECVVGEYSGNSFVVPLSKSGDYTAYIVTVDNSWNECVSPTSLIFHFGVPKDVTNFIAVKNGEYVNFSWDKQNDMNYEIRWGGTWESGKTIAKVNANVYSYFFPQIGSNCFSIKAFDGAGNYSETAAYLSIELKEAVARNVIAQFDESAKGWVGQKTNLKATGSELSLEEGMNKGEYITKVTLPEKVNARNWIQYSSAIISEDKSWDNYDTQWEDTVVAWMVKNDTQYCSIDNYIALFKGYDEYLNAFSMEDESNMNESQNISYGNCRYHDGVLVGNNTRISYTIACPDTFNMSFTVKHNENNTNNIVYMTMYGEGYWLRVGHDSKGFYLVDSKGQWNRVNKLLASGVIVVGVTQKDTKRELRIISISQNKDLNNTMDYVPLGEFTEVKI